VVRRGELLEREVRGDGPCLAAAIPSWPFGPCPAARSSGPPAPACHNLPVLKGGVLELERVAGERAQEHDAAPPSFDCATPPRGAGAAWDCCWCFCFCCCCCCCWCCCCWCWDCCCLQAGRRTAHLSPQPAAPLPHSHPHLLHTRHTKAAAAVGKGDGHPSPNSSAGSHSHSSTARSKQVAAPTA